MGFLSIFKSPEERFWMWFQENEKLLFTFEKDQESIFDELARQLSVVNQNLTFEFGPILENNKRQFIISADGIKSSFPAVEKLYKNAPELNRWIILKFRPRRNPINDIEIGDRKIKAEDVYYRIFKDENPNKVGIILFFRDFNATEANIYSQLGYLFLDEALGEYDVETKVGAIIFDSFDSKYYDDVKPLKELANNFDECFI